MPPFRSTETRARTRKRYPTGKTGGGTTGTALTALLLAVLLLVLAAAQAIAS